MDRNNELLFPNTKIREYRATKKANSVPMTRMESMRSKKKKKTKMRAIQYNRVEVCVYSIFVLDASVYDL